MSRQGPGAWATPTVARRLIQIPEVDMQSLDAVEQADHESCSYSSDVRDAPDDHVVDMLHVSARWPCKRHPKHATLLEKSANQRKHVRGMKRHAECMKSAHHATRATSQCCTQDRDKQKHG